MSDKKQCLISLWETKGKKIVKDMYVCNICLIYIYQAMQGFIFFFSFLSKNRQQEIML